MPTSCFQASLAVVRYSFKTLEINLLNINEKICTKSNDIFGLKGKMFQMIISINPPYGVMLSKRFSFR